MFVPFISSDSVKTLYRRKGGGGKGKGSSGSKSKGSSSSVSPAQHRTGYSWGSKSKSKSKTKGSKLKSSSPGFIPIPIPAGRLFAGRNEGGGKREGIYGTSTYGSGYPSSYAPSTQTGTSGLGFPYYFWPVAWAGAGMTAYDYRYSSEYGDPTNSSRPGGNLVFASYPSTNSKSGTFRVLADNGTIIDVINAIMDNCTSVLPSDSLNPTPISYTASPPNPDQAVQYYRASTVALTFDSFNASSSSPPPTFAPASDVVDPKILECLNYTIGASVPLDDGVLGLNASFGLLWMLFGIVSVLMGNWL